MKKVISVYLPGTFGLGDYIRGIIFLLQQPDVHVYAEYSTSCIAQCLYPKEPYQDGPIGRVLSLVHNEHERVLERIRNDASPVFIHTNLELVFPPTPEVRTRILEMFSWKPDFRSFMESLPAPENFVILHVRLRDQVSFGSTHVPELPNLDAFLEANPLSNVFVMSSSSEYKKRLCERYSFQCLNVNPIHTLSHHPRYEDIRDTLAEMFFISKASHLYQYNQDWWQTSGYSTRMCEVFGIPMTRIPT
jgi:hypothetical protein